MSEKGISRREFTAGVAALGALAATGSRAGTPPGAPPGRPDIAVAKGPDTAANISRAVAVLGGMGAFVKPGQTVDLLVNTLCQIPAGRTKPAVIRAVVGLCKAAGAKKIRALDWGGARMWSQAGFAGLCDELGVEYHYVDPEQAELWRKVPVPKGQALTQVRIFKALWSGGDVLLSLPTFKHHDGSGFSGSLKLFMATSHPDDNQGIFHRDESTHLEQCIADLNTVVRTPDLIIQEAMEVLLANGPFGPGPTARPEAIVAGADRVALDTYGTRFLDQHPERSTQIQAAHAHGLGVTDLKKLKIQDA